MHQSSRLIALGFKQDVGHREGDPGCYFNLCVVTIAFDAEGNGFSKVGKINLSKYGFKLIPNPVPDLCLCEHAAA